jgi:pimeloyl-ACP methyl ester carboxylesterase
MSDTDASSPIRNHRWRSPLLGTRREIALSGGRRLRCFRRGAGPALVFAHGWLANANLWRKVVDRLADRFLCVALDLPFGSHQVALGPGTDLTPRGCAELIAGAVAALDLDAVTLIGNDSGGAYSQIAAAHVPERVARLVLNSCETPYDAFPPPPFDGLPAAAATAESLGGLLAALRDGAVRRSPAAYGWLIKHPIEDDVMDSYVLPCLEDPAVLHDTCRVMRAAASAPVHAAGRRLIAEWRKPVLFAWSPEDRVFPIAHAERYAAALADGRLVRIDDAYSFTPEDQPERLAAAIRGFAG